MVGKARLERLPALSGKNHLVARFRRAEIELIDAAVPVQPLRKAKGYLGPARALGGNLRPSGEVLPEIIDDIAARAVGGNGLVNSRDADGIRLIRPLDALLGKLIKGEHPAVVPVRRVAGQTIVSDRLRADMVVRFPAENAVPGDGAPAYPPHAVQEGMIVPARSVRIFREHLQQKSLLAVPAVTQLDGDRIDALSATRTFSSS